MRKRFIFFSVVFLICVIGGALYSASVFFVPIRFPDVVEIRIEQGMSLSRIARLLYAHGVIRDPFLFESAIRIAGFGTTIKAGEYQFRSPFNFSSVARQLVDGVPKRERVITIREGWTVRDIARYLHTQQVVAEEDFVTAAFKNHTSPARAEGSLFPDTYRIFYDATADDIVTTLTARFEQFVLPEFDGAESYARRYSLHDILTLASIIEREVKTEDDRVLVSDILYRRLLIGMPLQVDSTVNYITGKKDASVSLQDTKIDSPYNTYRFKGIPPGPIGNPGLSAIRAALHPRANAYWYFLTPPDGSVVYAKTFAEHIRNKQKYLKR